MLRNLFSCVLLLAGCLPAPPPLDEDGDGSTWPDDCDDADAAVHPDAEETWYDGVDQDCDGASDYDADADGVDAADHGGLDCDDADAAVHPDAEETWYDGVDQDCDQRSDFDQDLDGYDCEPFVSEGCPETSAGDDCDDLVPAHHPGSAELINGEDDNCNGEVDEVPWGGGPSSVESYHGGMAGEGLPCFGFGYSVAPDTADVAGPGDVGSDLLDPAPDGIPDLLVGAPLGALIGSGDFINEAVYLVAGGDPAELSSEGAIGRTVLRLVPHVTDLSFGATVDWLPSLDGVIGPEILVGAPPTTSSGSEGHAYVFFSSTLEDATLAHTGTSTSPGPNVHTLTTEDAAAIVGAAEDVGFGPAMSMGDWDDTEGGEIAVTASGFHDGTARAVGRVYLFRGTQLAGGPQLITSGTFAASVVGTSEHQNVGAALPVRSELDGDGLPELVLSAPGPDESGGLLAAIPGGKVLNFSLNVDELAFQVSADDTVSDLGLRLAGGGDLDGDGHEEVAAQATRGGLPVIEVISGGIWSDSPETDIQSAVLFEVGGVALPIGLPRVGYADTLAFDLRGDYNADGFSDLVVGSSAGETSAGGGLVAIFYGGLGLAGTVVPSDADARLTGKHASWFGYAGMVGTDVTGDGLTELLVGAPGEDPSGVGDPFAGVLYVLDPTRGY